MDIPVYLIAGFLDAGKTEFINGILRDGFAAEDRTLLLCCEEGENGYDPKVLGNVFTYTVEDEDQLTPDFLKKLEKQYRPKQVIVEYNGMWSMEKLYREGLPANWILYQIMCLVDATTFEMYLKNMGQLMMEKITNCDMLIFNRCNEQLRAQLRSRNLRMANRRADIYLENEDGTSEEYVTPEMSPFDLTGGKLEVPDEDYGIWYVDMMDNPGRYEGVEVSFRALMCHSKKFLINKSEVQSWGAVVRPEAGVSFCPQQNGRICIEIKCGWQYATNKFPIMSIESLHGVQISAGVRYKF